MSIFKKLAKEETVLVKNVKLNKIVYDLVEKVAAKYNAEPGDVVKELVENSKTALQKELEKLQSKTQNPKNKGGIDV